jgi:hypothetical protein
MPAKPKKHTLVRMAETPLKLRIGFFTQIPLRIHTEIVRRSKERKLPIWMIVSEAISLTHKKTFTRILRQRISKIRQARRAGAIKTNAIKAAKKVSQSNVNQTAS